MNETLYHWTFNFHKVVRLQNSGAVEDFILLYSAVYLRIQKWKNYWNRSTFAKVIVKIKVARFLWPTVYIHLFSFWLRGCSINSVFRSKINSQPIRSQSVRGIANLRTMSDCYQNYYTSSPWRYNSYLLWRIMVYKFSRLNPAFHYCTWCTIHFNFFCFVACLCTFCE